MSWKLKAMFAGASVYWRVFQPLLLGAKVMLVQDGRVLLVRHSYQPGWFFPGGGVKRGEDLVTAVHREAYEELGAKLVEPRLYGVYSNTRRHKNDHTVLFVCTQFELGQPNDKEIVAAEFYAPDALPEDTSRGTRNRIREYWQAPDAVHVGVW
jgi:ADP-ribose pyrophosphatase YjhB (NUDIX family)